MNALEIIGAIALLIVILLAAGFASGAISVEWQWGDDK